MADIELTDLTNTKTCSTEEDGTGIFDRLIKSVEYHIEGQYKSGRIKGTDYANVYLGSMQSVLSESIKFLLNKQKAGKDADLVAAQIDDQKYVTENLRPLEAEKDGESIDLIIAQTAAQYESIDASKKDTYRKNLINAEELVKMGKESALLESKNADQEFVTANLRPLEVESAGESIDLIIAQTAAQYESVDASKKDTYRKNLINAEELIKLGKESALLQSRNDEQLAATTRMDLESAKKVLLIEAQTLGFKVDGKQKLLKQMFEGFAIEATTKGEIPNPPTLSSSASLEMVANSIFDDLEPTGGTI